MLSKSYKAIFDFGLLPYALGDVLTWNIQTAIRCLELSRDRVDVYICVDEKRCSSIFQRGLVREDNYNVHFFNIVGAFHTHPFLGTIHIFQDTQRLLEALESELVGDEDNRYVLEDYRVALSKEDDMDTLVNYFTKYIYFHEGMNAFAEAHGHIPKLIECPAISSDLDSIEGALFNKKKIVAVHFRLRRLDAGMGGEHTYFRDSSFLAWYGFLKEAEQTHPDVQFLLMGRLQEKPLEILSLPNVTTLRPYGYDLSHEISMLLRSDLFIGTSSGFAAAANFSDVPYFITHMNSESCNAYNIPDGADQLPFATDRQFLVYEEETKDLLMRLLEQGLASGESRERGDTSSHSELGPESLLAQNLFKEPTEIDVANWAESRKAYLWPGATNARFALDSEQYRRWETSFLLKPAVEHAEKAIQAGEKQEAARIVEEIDRHFPWLVRFVPLYYTVRAALLPIWHPNFWIARVFIRARQLKQQFARI